MGITFLTVDLVYNIVYPAFEAIDALRNTQSVKAKTENYALMQFMSDLEAQLILLFNF